MRDGEYYRRYEILSQSDSGRGVDRSGYSVDSRVTWMSYTIEEI